LKKIILTAIFWISFISCSSGSDFPSTDGEIISGTLAGFVTEVISNYSDKVSGNAAVVFDGGLEPSLMMKRKVESILTSKGFPVTDNPDSALTLNVKVTEASVSIVREGGLYNRTVRIGMHVRVIDSTGLILLADHRETAAEDAFTESLLGQTDDSEIYFRNVARNVYGRDGRGIMIVSFAVITAALFWFAFSV
jgi:hypothetical protein